MVYDSLLEHLEGNWKPTDNIFEKAIDDGKYVKEFLDEFFDRKDVFSRVTYPQRILSNYIDWKITNPNDQNCDLLKTAIKFALDAYRGDCNLSRQKLIEQTKRENVQIY